MKKVLLILSTIVFLISCQKEYMLKPIEDKPQKSIVNGIEINRTKHEVTYTQTTEVYDNTIFDSCRMENVHLTGKEVSKITEYDDIGYYIKYEIDLENITGVGEITGTIYKGGGKIVNITKTNQDNSNNFGSAKYRVVYKSKDNKVIKFYQTALFIKRNGVVLVDFNNEFVQSCK